MIEPQVYSTWVLNGFVKVETEQRPLNDLPRKNNSAEVQPWRDTERPSLWARVCNSLCFHKGIEQSPRYTDAQVFVDWTFSQKILRVVAFRWRLSSIRGYSTSLRPDGLQTFAYAYSGMLRRERGACNGHDMLDQRL